MVIRMSLSSRGQVSFGLSLMDISSVTGEAGGDTGVRSRSRFHFPRIHFVSSSVAVVKLPRTIYGSYLHGVKIKLKLHLN